MRKTMALLLALALALLAAGCAGGSGQQAAQDNSGGREVTSMTGGSVTGSQGAAETHEYAVEEVGFERDGKRIYGGLYLPDDEGPLPVVVVSHGFGGDSSQAASYARALARAAQR